LSLAVGLNVAMNSPEATALVSTTYGPVLGLIESGRPVFRGIPYAAPPFGELRFQAPAPPQPWPEARECFAFGPTVPKSPYREQVADLLPEPDIDGEDCLNLNVWSPDLAGSAPVLVWIHGGAFQNGSSAVSVYDGAAFARDGVVFVSINYRLGVDGFAHLAGCPDNRGLLDQIAALAWVRENIAEFGGDPERVTIAGESAGAMSVNVLTAIPAARGLFRRVIAQSGGAHYAITPATATLITAALAAKLGVEPTASSLANVDLPVLLAAHSELAAELALNPDPSVWGECAVNGMLWEPVIDGDTLPALPIELVAAGQVADVDLLVGSNDDEHTLFLYPVLDLFDQATVATLLAALGAEPAAYDTYVALVGSRPGDILVAGLTDWFFRVPALRLAETRLALGLDTFVYEFGWKTPVLDGVLGSTHALEIGFAFDTLAAPGADWLAGPDAPQELADHMHAAWVAFVKDGQPGWPAYGTARTTRRFSTEPDQATVIDDPSAKRRMLWPHR